ncbi:MAG: DUF2851 family protein [Verrucomicrobia bacterium]|nr:DUF2851 family protein [Verrucomicrobiota bacterium]
MSNHSPNFYSRWRAERVAAALREGTVPQSETPPERLLQAIWQHQRIARDRLRTLDGQPVRVLHPGFWNHEAGPDFRGAVVRIGAEPPRSGDVEVDLEPSAWRSHGHNENPAYKQIILHVVWDGAAAHDAALPTVALKSVLDAPLEELASSLAGTSAQELPAGLAGQCSAPLKELSDERRDEVLQQAALVRLQVKASQLGARAKSAGWEQALWEGLFAALGYKHNVWPMRWLAEWLPQLGAIPRSGTLPVRSLQAKLLGLGGLLPVELPRNQKGAETYLRGLWDEWWRERERLSDGVLPRAAWRFNGLRPANQPQRRLALAAHWLADGSFFTRLEKWFLSTNEDEPLALSLLEVLSIERDEFWSWHWTFNSARMPKPQLLLGAARVGDLAVNVILPWFWMRAAAGGNESLRDHVERRYLAWPAGEDNAVLRLARQRLLGGAGRRVLRTAAAQQGLLQIVRDFCDHSNAVCTDCRFPDLVRSLSRAS